MRPMVAPAAHNSLIQVFHSSLVAVGIKPAVLDQAALVGGKRVPVREKQIRGAGVAAVDVVGV